MTSKIVRISLAVMVALGLAGYLFFGPNSPVKAAAGINQQLNFQGRLLDNTGAVVPDGNYNMEFKIVQDGDGCNPPSGTFPCSGTVKWTEDWLVHNTQGVTVKNGYFSANLGSITSFGSNVDWNQDTLWLSINIGGTANTASPTWDGAMKPLKRLSASPYALNSLSLQGLQASNFVQLAQGAQTDSSTTNPSIFINKTGGTANILELQRSGDVFVVDNGGGLSVTPTTASSLITLGSTSQTGQITIGQSTANNTISIGSAAGNGNTQTISIGTSSTAGSITNVTIGSTVAGTVAIQGPTTITGRSSGSATGLAITTGTTTQRALSITGTSGQNGDLFYLTGNTNGGYHDDISINGYGALKFINSASSKAGFLQNIPWDSNGIFDISQNLYAANNGGTGLYYDQTAAASQISFTQGTIALKVAPSGTAGSSATPTTIENIDNTGAVTFTPRSNSGTSFEVQNQSGNQVLTVDTSGGQAILGKSTSINGTIVFDNSAGPHTVGLSLQADPGSSYTLLLPTTGPSTSQCLGTDASTASQLVFTACGGGLTTVSYSSSQNANGGSISGATLTLNKADGSNPGLVSADSQTFGGTKTFNGGLTIAGGQNLTLNSGAGAFSQTYSSGSAGSAQSLSVTNSNAGASSIAINGLDLTLTGTATSGGTNTNSGIKFENPSAATNNVFYALNFAGTGYTDVLRVNGNQIINGSGVLNSNGLSGTYSNALTLNNSSNAITTNSLTATGGTINGTTIGATTATSGIFTTLQANTSLNLTNNSDTDKIFQVNNNALATNNNQLAYLSFKNNSGTGNTINGLTIAESAAANGSDTSNLINLTAAAGGTINALNVGSNFTNALVVGGTIVVNGSGGIDAGRLTSGNYVKSITNGAGISGGNGGSNAAALTLAIDTTAGLTWTNSEGFSLPAGKSVSVSASAAPTVDMFTVSNSGQNSATNGVDGEVITFGATNASGDALHITPTFTGGTTALTYNGLEFDAFSPTNSTGTDTVNGIKVGNLTDPGASITSNAINIGSGWDNVLSVNGTLVINGSGGIDTGRLTSGNYVATISNGNGITGSCSSNNCAATLSVNNGNGLTFSGSALTTNNGNGLKFSGSALTIDYVSGGGLTMSGTSLTVDTGASLTWTGAESFTLGSNNLVVNANGTGKFKVQGNGTDALTVDSSGNVTIGESSANGPITLNTGSSGALTLTGHDNSTWQITNGTLAITSSGNQTLSSTGGNVTLTSANGSDVVVNNQVSIDAGVDALNGIALQNSGGTNLVSLNTLSSNLNLIPNSSFEQNINGWTAKGAATISQDSTAGNTANGGFGNSTLKSVDTASGDGVQYAYPLIKSKQYTFTVEAKTSSGSTTMQMGWQENGSDVVTGCTATSVSTTWAPITCTFTTTSGTFNSTTNIFIKQTVTGTPTVFFDGATLVPASTGLTYVNPGQNIDINSSYDTLTLNNNQSAEPQPWQLGANTPATGRRFATVATGDGYMYFIGGETSTPALSQDVSYTKLNSDGSAGAWTSLGNLLPAGTYGHSTVVYNGYLYVLGGCITTADANANCTARTSSVYYSQIKPDGTLGKFFTNPYSLTAATGFGSAVVANGYMYYLGGYTGSVATAVMSAKINADGTTGPFSNAANAMNTGTGAGVYGGAAVVANGNIYVVGGCTDTASGSICNTASNVVQYTTPTVSGGDSTFTATGNNTNFTATGLNNAVLLNGYIYSIGGRQSSAAVNTVSYAKILSNSLLGPWTNDTTPTDTSHPLPFPRQGAATLENNSYIYTVGGTDSTAGTNVYSTVYQSGGARTVVYGGLDLVGLSGLTMSDPSGQGTLTAGDTKILGNLRVDNLTTLNNGLAVNGAVNISNTAAVVSVLNITNQPSTTAANNQSLFQIRDLTSSGANAFGGLAIAGGFAATQSYFNEEYNVFNSINCVDNSSSTAAETNNESRGTQSTASAVRLAAACNGTSGNDMLSAEMSTSKVTTAASASNSCTFASGAAGTNTNGYEAISAATTTSTPSTSCEEYIGTATDNSANDLFNSNNLPQAQFKFRPVAVASNQRFFIGLDSRATAATTMATGDKGAYFTNCTQPTAGTCGTTLVAAINDGTTAPNSGTPANAEACPATDSQGDSFAANKWMYGRIEFRKAPSGTAVEVEFFVDYDVTDGIHETSCGTITTLSNSGFANSAMTAMMANSTVTVNSTTTELDVDYVRVWQDDAPAIQTPGDTQSGQTSQPANDGTGNTASDSSSAAAGSNPPDLLGTPPLSTALTQDQPTIVDFSAATSEDAVFAKDVYVQGTLFANKVVANQIEGLDVITDEIDSLKDKLATSQPSSNQTGTTQTPNTGLNTSGLTGSINFNSLQAANLVVLTQTELRGGLTVNSDALFNGKTIFQLLAQFNGPAQFNDQVTFNNDAGGQVIIHQGAQKVNVKFSKEYKQAPIIVANWLMTDSKDANGNITDSSDAKLQRLIDAGYSYTVANVTTKGFDIYLNKAATEDISLSWLATAINNAQTTESSQ